MNYEILSCDQLDGHCELFGFTITKRKGLSPLVTLYIEDDENWFPKLSFDVFWISDLEKMIKLLKEVL